MRLLDILFGTLVLFPLLADAAWFEIPGFHSLALSDLGIPLLAAALIVEAARRWSRWPWMKVLWPAAGVLGALFLLVLLWRRWAPENAIWNATHGGGAVTLVALVAVAVGQELLFPPGNEARAGMARCACALAGPHTLECCGCGGSALSLGFALASPRFRDAWVRLGHFHQRDLESDAWEWLRFVGERRNQPLLRPPIAFVLGAGSLVLDDSAARNLALCAGVRACRGRSGAVLPRARAARSRALGAGRFALALLVLSS